jgi:alpha-L-rhamnosidase
MQGGFSVSFFESLGGIRPAGAGFQKILFQPCFLPDMDWAQVEHESPYGRISSHWKKEENGRVVWEIVVPPNTTAEVRVPVLSDKVLVEMPDAQRDTVRFLRDGAGYKAYGVPAGSYRFTVKTSEENRKTNGVADD